MLEYAYGAFVDRERQSNVLCNDSRVRKVIVCATCVNMSMEHLCVERDREMCYVTTLLSSLDYIAFVIHE